VADRSPQEADRGGGFLIVEDLDVGQACGVVDRDVHEFTADDIVNLALTVDALAGVAPALAADAMAGSVVDAPEFLDIDMDRLARPLTLVALRGSRPRRPSLPIPMRVRIPETVESAIPSTSAISAPVNRTRRSAAIASTRRSCVRLATSAGADERSNRPSGPSARWRASHLRAVRSLTPAAAAASISDHPATSIRSTNNSRPFTLRRALACNFIRCPPWNWRLRHQPASKEARMNNVLRFYN